jgi:hypothetical protein
MAAGQPVNFGKGIVNFLGIKSTAAFKKSILITKAAMVRATPGNYNRIWHKIQMPFDKVTADWGHFIQRADG